MQRGQPVAPESGKRKAGKNVKEKRGQKTVDEEKIVNAVFDDVFKVDQNSSRLKPRKLDELTDEDMGNLIPADAKKTKEKAEKAEKKADRKKGNKKSLWDEDDMADAIRGEEKPVEAGVLFGLPGAKLALFGGLAFGATVVLIILYLVFLG